MCVAAVSCRVKFGQNAVLSNDSFPGLSSCSVYGLHTHVWGPRGSSRGRFRHRTAVEQKPRKLAAFPPPSHLFSEFVAQPSPLQLGCLCPPHIVFIMPRPQLIAVSTTGNNLWPLSLCICSSSASQQTKSPGGNSQDRGASSSTTNSVDQNLNYGQGGGGKERSISMVDMYIDNSEPVENVGQIHFSLEYDFQNTTLILKIIQVSRYYLFGATSFRPRRGEHFRRQVNWVVVLHIVGTSGEHGTGLWPRTRLSQIVNVTMC